MPVDVVKLLDRIKHLEEFKVTLDMPEEFVFEGTVPWNMKIVDGTATVNVLALSQEEANSIVYEYFYR